ncbi:MAG TPA: hypothetical protein VFA59_06630 [Vicinamibacterales bacterium]|nr:hypothetical protein [Vicinamibacterales bacterium]
MRTIEFAAQHVDTAAVVPLNTFTAIQEYRSRTGFRGRLTVTYDNRGRATTVHAPESQSSPVVTRRSMPQPTMLTDAERARRLEQAALEFGVVVTRRSMPQLTTLTDADRARRLEEAALEFGVALPSWQPASSRCGFRKTQYNYAPTPDQNPRALIGRSSGSTS